MFFIAAALLLTTAGVFAGKAKFLASAFTPDGVAFASNNAHLYTTGTSDQIVQLQLGTGTTIPLYQASTGSVPVYYK